jgi:uncharacterized membrane protein
MLMLAATLFIFGVIHINPAMPAWKAHALATFGKAYGPLYGITSLVLLVAVMVAFRYAEPGFIYEPPKWGFYANFAFSLVGFMCLSIALFRGSWRNQLRYPIAIGMCLWAAGHLVSNGEQRSVLLFVGLACAAALHAILKSKQPFTPGDVRQGHNLLSLFGGLALYALAAQLHAVIAGVPLVVLQ